MGAKVEQLRQSPAPRQCAISSAVASVSSFLVQPQGLHVRPMAHMGQVGPLYSLQDPDPRAHQRRSSGHRSSPIFPTCSNLDTMPRLVWQPTNPSNSP
eukprot:363965-Chlamydomonas_euryale.AAC.4